jgi:DNA-binding NtrC family response regulator
LLQRHTWPGNVRELKNVVHKALLLARGFTITRELVQKARDQISHSGSMADTAMFARTQSFPDRPLAAFISELLDKAERGESENVQAIVMEAVEKELYGEALVMAEGDQTKAAGLLGISRPTMREKLSRYHLLPVKSRPVEPAAV